MSGALDADVEPLLGTSWLGRAWRHLPACGSTNDEAATWARAGAPAGAVVTSDEQTRGRGRLGRAWHSPPGASLYFSVVLRPSLKPAEVPPVTLAAGVAVAEAIARFAVAPALKWPNVLLVGGRKVAGILTEMATTQGRIEHLVVGVGVNLNVPDFPDELSSIAASLHHARGRAVDRALFAATLCERLEVWLERFLADGAPAVVDGWKRFAPFFGTRLTLSAAAGVAPVSGIAQDLDPDGALRLLTDDGRSIRVVAGEVLP